MTQTPELTWPEDDSDDQPLPSLQELQAELEQESAPIAKAKEIAAGLDDLDELLAESMELVEQTRKAKEARARIRQGNSTQADNELVRAWEERYEWKTVATAGIFQKFLCRCGNIQTIFDSLMLHQHHKRSANTDRWITTDHIQPGLPIETVVRERKVEMCGVCATRHGVWALDAPRLWRN